MNYNFEWDPHKAQLNYEKHGIRFEGIFSSRKTTRKESKFYGE